MHSPERDLALLYICQLAVYGNTNTYEPENFHRGQECDECGTASNDALPLAVSISDTFHTAGCMALVQVFRGIAAILTVPCAILSLTQILLRPSLSPDQCNTIPFALSKWVFITLPGLFSILALRRLNMWKTRRAKPEDSHKTLWTSIAALSLNTLSCPDSSVLICRWHCRYRNDCSLAGFIYSRAAAPCRPLEGAGEQKRWDRKEDATIKNNCQWHEFMWPLYVFWWVTAYGLIFGKRVV